MKRSRLLALVTAATTVVALAACAAPEDDNEGTTTESGVKANEATSVADFGTMDDLIAAAQEEGELNVIALPPDWANYGEIIDTFAEKYDIKVNSDQPTAASQDEINAANDLEGHRQGAPTSSTSASRSPSPTSRCTRRTRSRPGTTSRPSSRTPTAPGSTTTAATWPSATTRRRCPDMTSVADLLKPEYKGAVALNGDPTQAGAAFSGVMMAAVANGGSADDIAPGVDFFG